MSFEDEFRKLARRNGEPVSDKTPVVVSMTGEWSGYSEYTITNQWDQFTVTCGGFSREYDNEVESRYKEYDRETREYTYKGKAVGPLTALSKLWDDLNG